MAVWQIKNKAAPGARTLRFLTMNQSERAEIARINAALKERLLRRLSGPQTLPTAIDGLMLFRGESSNMCGCACSKPTAGIIVQGCKNELIGGREFRYGENQCLVIGTDMPTAFRIVDPSSERPFLSVYLYLDRQIIAQLAAEIGHSGLNDEGPCRSTSVADADADLLGAFLRLLELLDKPEQIAVRAPMIIRELHCLLLLSPQGADLRRLNTFGTRSHQVARAVSWLRENFRQALQVEALARQVHMATSTFHRHFKEVTGLSPLQFHKQLRLYEAQRLMLVESLDVTSACYEVGYESPTQFIREYKRQFGAPPHRDMVRRREGAYQDNVAASF